MEQYAQGERVYLSFKIENIKGDQFTLLKTTNTDQEGNVIKPTYILSLNDVIKDTGDMDIVGTNKDSLRFYFKPDEKGMYLLDIWYYIQTPNTSSTSGTVTSNLTPLIEKRTVRFQLPVVR